MKSALIFFTACLLRHSLPWNRLIKIDAKCPHGCIAGPVVVSHLILIQNWCKMFSWLYCRSCVGFVFISSKIDSTFTLGCTVAPVVVTFSILNQNWSKRLSWFCLLVWCFAYSTIIQNWCKMLSWLYCRSCGGFLLFLIQNWCKPLSWLHCNLNYC